MSTNTGHPFEKQAQKHTSHVPEVIPTRSDVMGLHLTHQSYAEFIQDVLRVAQQRISAYGCFANVHMLVETIKDSDFSQVVNKARWVAADGVPLLWALQVLRGIRQERITGLDVLPTLFQEAASNRLPVYIYGSTQQVLDRCKAFCSTYHPDLPLVGLYSPPFRPLSPAEEQDVIDAIIASRPALVFVALGCPKQEKWMAAMSSRIPAVLLGIGGALPVLVGEQKRAPRWMQQWGLEWFFRFIQEPRRLFRRYMSTNLLFLFYFLKQLMSGRNRPG